MSGRLVVRMLCGLSLALVACDRTDPAPAPSGTPVAPPAQRPAVEPVVAPPETQPEAPAAKPAAAKPGAPAPTGAPPPAPTPPAGDAPPEGMDFAMLQELRDIRDSHGGGPPIWYSTAAGDGRYGPWPISAQMLAFMQQMGRPSEVELRSYSLPLNNPGVVKASEATHVRDDDLVVGILVGEHARAYPWWILVNFHVVNDIVGGVPTYVAQCEVCSGAGHFDPVLDGWPLDFRVCGANNGTFYVCDFQTKSAWTSFSGRSFAGPLKGRQMKRRPIYQSNWAEWKALHPHTDVVYAAPELREREHGKNQHLGKEKIEHQLKFSVWNHDARLKVNELVFGLQPATEGEGRGRVYTLRKLREVGGFLQAEWLGDPIAFVHQGDHRVGCFVRRVGEHTLDLSVASKDPLRMKDDRGNTWDEWGTAIDGPDKGASLSFAQGYLTEWYEWVNHYPECEIVDVAAAPGQR